MKRIKNNDVIYLKSDAIVLNKDQIDPFEDLIGDINDQLEKKGMSLCYCYDELKNNKAKIHGWDLRPYPEPKT
tara:strand:+ start:283 stop:501 length:219 start_codon:yes stop_codon:yes gene_type:complete